MTGRRFLIGGRVQGVGFRWFVQRRALALGVTGLVRNLPDGRVEVEAFGPDDVLDKLASILGIGPPAAHVTKVEISEISDELDLSTDFRVVG